MDDQSVSELKTIWEKKVFFFDIDGTIMLGHKEIPGACRFLDELQRRGKHVFILSNNSSYRTDERLKILLDAGFHITGKNYLTSTKALIQYLVKHQITRIYLLAMPGVVAEFADYGIQHSEINPQAIILTFDRSLDYAKIAGAAKWITAGIPYYATHLDLVCPTENGYIPDAGSFAAMFKAATGKEPEKVFGKPDPNMILGIIEELGVDKQDVVMFGDRTYTDIQLAKNAGIVSVGLLSGEATRADLERCQPDLIVESLNEFNKL
jgi:HAD superfamily hydrolase (TIGR01450 family)